MKRTLLLLLTLCVFAFAQKPKVLVAVTPPTGKAAGMEAEAAELGSQLTEAIVNGGKYTAIDASSETLALVASEHKRQRSGAVDEAQIVEMAKQSGAQSILRVEITKLMGQYMLKSRLVDVKTLDISGMASVPSKLSDLGEFLAAAETIAAKAKLVGAGAASEAADGYGKGVFIENDPENEAEEKALAVLGERVAIAANSGTCVSGVKGTLTAEAAPCSENTLGYSCSVELAFTGKGCKDRKTVRLRGKVVGSNRYSEETAMKQVWRNLEKGETPFWDEWESELRPYAE
jgi:hypothetical protein